MAKAISRFTIQFQGEVAESNPTEVLIVYTVADGDLKKTGELLITENPQDVTWASAKTSINTAEDIS